MLRRPADDVAYHVKNSHHMQIFHIGGTVIVRQKYLDQPMRFRNREACPKMVVALRGGYPANVDGIGIAPAAGFLLHRA